MGWAQGVSDSSASAQPSPSLAQTSTAASQASAAVSQASMAASIQKQRASVQKQVSAITGKAAPAAASFFTVPWVDTVAGGFNVPACDPMPDEQLDKLIEESSTHEGVKPDLVRAVISEESANRPCAVSPKGAQGLMQLMPETASVFGVKNPFDPKENVDAGTKMLKQLLDKYGGDLSKTLSAYNAGAGRVDQEGGVPPIAETVNYVKDILEKLSQK
jgi:soluble lytic murein transglycosylase-like protein